MSDAERAPSAPEERSAPDTDASITDQAPSARSPPPPDPEAEAADAEAEAKEEERRRNNASAAALTLEIVGDLPHAEIKPPENILFVCKLNPVTRSDDLELIFSRFGKINSCEVIRDKKYAFVEYDDREAAERAYTKMQNVLIDDRRIWVDFSQSVSKLHSVWVKQRMGRGAAPARAPPPRRTDNDPRRNRAPNRSAPLTHPDMHTENVLVDLDVLRDDPRMHRPRHEDRDRRDDRREGRSRHDRRDDYRRGSRSDYERRDRDDDRYYRDRDRHLYERERYGRHRDERRSDRPRYDDRPRSRPYEARGKDRARSRSP